MTPLWIILIPAIWITFGAVLALGVGRILRFTDTPATPELLSAEDWDRHCARALGIVSATDDLHKRRAGR